MGVWRPHNIGKATLSGVEIEKTIRHYFMKPDIFSKILLNYTYLSAKNLSDDPTIKNKQLIRRPENKANVSIELTFAGAISILPSCRYISQRYITAANTKSINSYLVYDFAAHADVTDSISVKGIVRNLTNREYVEVNEFPVPGREYEIKFSYTFF